MKIFLIVFFIVLALIFFFGMVGDNLQKNRDNYTLAFIVSVGAIVLMHIFG